MKNYTITVNGTVYDVTVELQKQQHRKQQLQRQQLRQAHRAALP